MSTIITRNSANSGSVPSSLVQGELAINVTDGRLFYGSGSGVGNAVKEYIVTSASYALTASYVNPLTQDVQVTGSLSVNNGTYKILDTTDKVLNDNSGNTSTNWFTRQLISADGVSIAANWSTKELLSTGNRVSIDWENRELVGSDGLTHILNWNNTSSAWFSGSLYGTASWAINALTASYVNPLQQNVILTGSLYLSTPGVASIYFTGSGIPGQLTWNDTDGTLELGLKGGVVKTEVGQGLVTRVINKTSPNIDLSGSDYQVVIVSGAQGQRLAVRLAQGDNDANSAGTLGVVAEDIAKNQEGFIITVGLLKNRNTTGALQGETWNDGDILYLSPTTAGAITNIKPQAPQHTVVVGYVEYAHAVNGKIYVKIDNGYEIDELHNVRITTASLAPGQLLIRSGSNSGGVWVNSNQLTGSYGLTGSLTATSFTGSLLGTASYATTALTASYVAGASGFPYTGSAQITGSLIINNYLNTATQVTANAGSTTIYTLPTASYDGAWFEYTARSGSNARAGQITSIWSGSSVNFTETTTTDFGSTSDLFLGVFIIGANMALTASAATSGWTIKTIVRSI